MSVVYELWPLGLFVVGTMCGWAAGAAKRRDLEDIVDRLSLWGPLRHERPSVRVVRPQVPDAPYDWQAEQ